MASGSLLLEDIHRDTQRDHSDADIAARKTQLGQNIEQLRALRKGVQRSELEVAKVERQWRALCVESSRFEGLLLEAPDQIHYSAPPTGAHEPTPAQSGTVFQPHDIDDHPQIADLARSAASLQDEHDSAATDAQERRQMLAQSICQAHLHAPAAYPPRGVHQVQLALWRLFHSAAQTYQRQVAVNCVRVLFSGPPSATSRGQMSTDGAAAEDQEEAAEPAAEGSAEPAAEGSAEPAAETDDPHTDLRRVPEYKKLSDEEWRDLVGNIVTLYRTSRSSTLYSCKIQIGAQRVFMDIAKRFPHLGKNPLFTMSLLIDQIRNCLYDNFTRAISLDYMCSRRMNGMRVTYASDYKRLCKEYRHNIFMFADARIVGQDSDCELCSSTIYSSHRSAQLSLRKRKNSVLADNQDARSSASKDNLEEESDAGLRSIEVLIQEFEKRLWQLNSVLRDPVWKQASIYQPVYNVRERKDTSIADRLAHIRDRDPDTVSFEQLLIMAEAILEELSRSRLMQAEAIRTLARNVGDVCGIPEDQLFVDTYEIWMELAEAVSRFKAMEKK